MPYKTSLPQNLPFKIPFLGSLGLFLSRFLSDGSMPMASAGSESVSRFINSRCTGSKGVGNAITEQNSTTNIAARLPDNRKSIAFIIFL